MSDAGSGGGSPRLPKAERGDGHQGHPIQPLPPERKFMLNGLLTQRTSWAGPGTANAQIQLQTSIHQKSHLLIRSVYCTAQRCLPPARPFSRWELGGERALCPSDSRWSFGDELINFGSSRSPCSLPKTTMRTGLLQPRERWGRGREGGKSPVSLDYVKI